MTQLAGAAPHAADMTKLVSGFIEAWSERSRKEQQGRAIFAIDGVELNDADMSASDGAFPLVIWHAENLYRYGVKGGGFGASYRTDAEALLERSASLRKAFRANSEVLLFTLEALEDMRKHLPRSEAAPHASELRSLVNSFAVAMGVTHEVGSASPVGATVRPS